MDRFRNWIEPTIGTGDQRMIAGMVFQFIGAFCKRSMFPRGVYIIVLDR